MAAEKRAKAKPKKPAKKGSARPAPESSRAARGLPTTYPKLLEEIKTRIRTAQIKASLSVNRELIQLYWYIGLTIVEQQQREGWGASVIERLAADLRAEFPGISGFSRTNLFRMRSFYRAYARTAEIVPQAVGQLPSKHVARTAQQIVPQVAGRLEQAALPPVMAEIPWGHNVALLEKLKEPVQRLWYAHKTIQHGWSRAVLVHQIESDLYSRQGQAITNFQQTLPAAQSDLARELLKDPYSFDFLAPGPDISERELERTLLEHLKQFLLELGAGFAFVGSQYPLQVGEQDYYLDLLFYHLRLRAYVVIDLKVEAFKPEFAGKMNFYLSAVDDLLCHPDDQSSIGLILCKERNRVVVEYALRNASRPMGVATYRVLPKQLKASLPSPKQLERELQKGLKPRTTETANHET